ncbi:MAG: hypothetical protein ACRCT6_11740, partial [Notoacmeibacter sp.]
SGEAQAQAAAKSEATDAQSALAQSSEAAATPKASEAASKAASSAQASTAQSETSAAQSEASSSAAASQSANVSDADAVETAPQKAKDAQEEAKFNPELAEELKSSAPAEGGKELSVLSRQAVAGEKRIVVSGLDRTTEEAATTKVGTASSVLTLEFDPLGTRIDEATATAVGSFFTENSAAIKDRPLVIWSFASAQSASVSEARRVAYYRALATRNELIKNGVAPENINVEIRFNENSETLNTVQIMAVK